MEPKEPKRPKRRGPEKQYTERVPVYATPKDVDLLDQLAEHFGGSQSAAVRKLIRDKAQELHLQPG